MTSEIARIRGQIDQEVTALHHAKQYAIVARHEVITHHFERLSVYFEELKAVIGEQQAIACLMEEMERGGVC